MTGKSYVFHESTTRNLSRSIQLIRCSQRTTLQFLYVVPSERSLDSSTGQAERASVEHPIAIVHLQDNIDLGNKSSGRKTNVSSCLFRLMFDEEQLRPQVSTANTGFTRGTYSNPVECHLMTPFHLTERFRIISVRITNDAGSRTFQNCLYITHQTMNHTQCLCNSYASLVLGQSIQSLESGLDLALPQQLLCEFL